MPSLFNKIQAKLEIFRLEQRYTRNRHRRSTFISNATYVDGEYVYNTPSSTGSSSSESYSSREQHSNRSQTFHTSAIASVAERRTRRQASPPRDLPPPREVSERSTPVVSPSSVRFEEEEERDYYAGRRRNSIEHSAPQMQEEQMQTTQQRKKLNRFSSMPGFGGRSLNKRASFAQDWRS